MGSVQLDYTLKNQSWTDELGAILQYYKSGRLPFSTGAGTSDLNLQGDGLTALLEVNSLVQTSLDVGR